MQKVRNVNVYFPRKFGLICLVLAFFCITSVVFAGEETLYVQSVKAKVYSAPSFNSNVLMELTKGFKVNVIDKEGNWAKVIIAGKTAYLSSFLLGKNPPMDKVKLSDEALSVPKDNPRSRVSQQTTAVAGVRGLAQERRARLGKEERVNYEALEKVESVVIKDDELNFFMKEGNL